MSTSDRTIDRPLPFHRRHDLIVARQRFGDAMYWVVKDPLSFRFVRLREPEYALFEAIDGRRSLRDLLLLYETRFLPQRIRMEEISRFVGMLYQSGLLLSDRPGQGPTLETRGRTRRQRERRGRWLNPLVIRFRGIDPTRLFDLLYPIVRPVLSRAGLIASCVLVVSAVLLVVAHWSELTTQLPRFDQFFTPSNLLLLTLVTGGVKILHEFGHGLACRHFGGECRELGAMLLVFTPCLYCDVTDSWRFASKWRRAAVGAAGIVVELNLAAIAAFIWWFSEPGLVHQICLGVLMVASFGTIVFNGNPLMRYDGYYILSDLVEVPNLAERSAAVLRDMFSRNVLGLTDEPDAMMPTRNRGWYAAYAIASVAYQWIVAVSIILFLVAAARPYRLESAARFVGLMGLSALVLWPVVRLGRFLGVPGTWQRVRNSRCALTTGAIVLVLAAILFAPLPRRVFGPLEMQPYDSTAVYVEVPGRIVETSSRYGEPLVAGALVAQLENRDLDLKVEDLTARRDRQRAVLTSLRRQQFENASAALSIPHAEKLLDSLQEQLDQKLLDQARLTLTASHGGTFFPPVVIPSTSGEVELPSWTGRPLDPINQGCAVDVGLELGRIGESSRWQASIVLDQEDVEFVKPGDSVDVLLDAFPGEFFPGRVEDVAIGELRETPHRLSSGAGGEVSTKQFGQSSERPTSTSYLVRVPISDPDGRLRVGWRGTARVHVSAASLASRLWRQVSRTFHFHL